MSAPIPARIRMTSAQRRAQLIEVGRALFAEKGIEGTSVEEIAASAGVSSHLFMNISEAKKVCMPL